MLTLTNIHRSVNNNHILKNINLTIKQGQVIALVGPNGCGKTSLLNIISGFHQPVSGTLRLYDRDIASHSVSQRAKLGIGRVFQHVGIFRHLSVYENLALAYFTKLHRRQKLLPISRLSDEQKSNINEVLQKIDLTGHHDRLAGELSGGQMRLLEIGRLYLQDTQIFLLDEPTAGVSPKLKGKVIEFIKDIIAKGKTVVIVEHDFNFLSAFVDEICVMNDGQIVLEGKYHDIKDSDVLKQIYFGK